MSDDTSKPFLEHLEELRLRFLRVLHHLIFSFAQGLAWPGLWSFRRHLNSYWSFRPLT